MDNVAAVRYVNHLGGTKSKVLVDLTTQFWEYCLAHHVSVTAEHLPGLSNVVADWNS